MDEEGRANVDLLRAPPLLGVSFPRQSFAAKNASTIDDHVDGAFGQDDIEHRFDVAHLGEVGPHRAHPRAASFAFARGRREARNLSGYEHELAAGGGQPFGEGAADAPGGSGDEDPFARLHARSSAPFLRAALTMRLRTPAVSSAVRVWSLRKRRAKARDFLPSPTWSPV